MKIVGIVLCMLLMACSADERKRLGSRLAAPAGITQEDWDRCEDQWSSVPREMLGRFKADYFRESMRDAPPATHERLRKLTDAQLRQDVRDTVRDEQAKGCFYWLMMSYCGTYQIMQRPTTEAPPGWYVHMRGVDDAGDAERERNARAENARYFLEGMAATTNHWCDAVEEDAPAFYLAHILGRKGQWWKTRMGGDGEVCPYVPRTGTED